MRSRRSQARSARATRPRCASGSHVPAAPRPRRPRATAPSAWAWTVFAVAAIASAVSQDVWQLIGSRFVLGIAVGTASFVSPMYIGELVPPKIRGGLVSFNQLMITSGILLAYIVDFALKDVSNNWRWMLGLGAIPGMALAVGMFFMPESPRWLVEQDREDDARKVLCRARRKDQVDDELDE